jgi:signal transduction histidine kinase
VFERFSEHAMRAVFWAQDEAWLLGAERVETEHLLLGILRDDPRGVSKISTGDATAIRRSVEQRAPKPESPRPTKDPPLRHGSKRAIAFGFEEADALQHKLVDTPHLLLGLLREDCTAAKLLRKHGLDYDRYRAALRDEQLEDRSVRLTDLLSLSRVASNSKPFTMVDLNDVVRTVVSDLEMRIQDASGRVEIGTLPVIFGDRGQMAQLFQNLIGNGIKFRKPGESPLVKIDSHAQTLPGGAAGWRITVEDNGIGFDEKYRDRIFQIFQRLHGRSEYEGTGIGLAICRKIVDRHSGAIEANSLPGTGAKFIITLPGTWPESAPGDKHHE